MTDIVADWGETPDEIAQRIYLLRKTGVPFDEIRKSLGHDGVDLTIAQLTKLHREFMVSLATAWGTDEREHMRMLEMERLDALQRNLWTTAFSGDIDMMSIKATETILKIMAQRQKLTGMDTPVGSDKTTVQTLLIVGDDKASFMDALVNGRDSAPVAASVTGRPVDDDEDEKEHQ